MSNELARVNVMETIFFDKCFEFSSGIFRLKVCGKANTYPESVGTEIVWDCPFLDIKMNIQLNVQVRAFIFSFSHALTLCIR